MSTSFIFKILKIELENIDHMLFFPYRCHECLETNFLIFFTLQIKGYMDHIKALHIEMDVFHKKNNLIMFWKLFGALVVAYCN